MEVTGVAHAGNRGGWPTPAPRYSGGTADVSGRQLQAPLADHGRQRVGHHTGRVVKTSPLDAIAIGGRGQPSRSATLSKVSSWPALDLEVDQWIDLR